MKLAVNAGAGRHKASQVKSEPAAVPAMGRLSDPAVRERLRCADYSPWHPDVWFRITSVSGETDARL